MVSLHTAGAPGPPPVGFWPNMPWFRAIFTCRDRLRFYAFAHHPLLPMVSLLVPPMPSKACRSVNHHAYDCERKTIKSRNHGLNANTSLDSSTRSRLYVLHVKM